MAWSVGIGVKTSEDRELKSAAPLTVLRWLR